MRGVVAVANIDFIQKRIEGKEKEIDKVQKKISRIKKAQSTNWEINPYYYSERDLIYAEKDLQNAIDSLNKYKKDLEVEQQKAESRTVPAILEFLEGWKIKTSEFYHNQFQKYLNAKNEYYEQDRVFSNWYNNEYWQWRREGRTEEIKQMNVKWKQFRNAFNEKWNWITPYVNIDEFLESKFQRDINEEANRKYDFIIERTNQIVGKITDASNLYVGDKGDLNGFIIGTNGVAKVQTIGAGGYNIQCFHFRTLISRMK